MRCKYTINTILRELRVIENVCKKIEFRYKDGREPAHKFAYLLQELRSTYIHVPDPKKPGTRIIKSVFNGVYVNTDTTTVTVMMVVDRAEAWSVYEKIITCLFAWLYGHWVLLGYSDRMIKSLMEGLGPTPYDLEKTCKQLQPRDSGSGH